MPCNYNSRIIPVKTDFGKARTDFGSHYRRNIQLRKSNTATNNEWLIKSDN